MQQPSLLNSSWRVLLLAERAWQDQETRFCCSFDPSPFHSTHSILVISRFVLKVLHTHALHNFEFRVRIESLDQKRKNSWVSIIQRGWNLKMSKKEFLRFLPLALEWHRLSEVVSCGLKFYISLKAWVMKIPFTVLHVEHQKEFDDGVMMMMMIYDGEEGRKCLCYWFHGLWSKPCMHLYRWRVKWRGLSE
jgi:hypothetical protein